MKKIAITLLMMMLAFTMVASAEPHTLVAYYSSTGTTQRVAEIIAEKTQAEIFVIEPAQPYTAEDLDWTNPESRCVKEHEAGEAAVELVSTSVPDWDRYDVVYIGYPIWWQDASWVMNSFVSDNDFTGKTVIPFCTSMSSGYGESGERLSKLTETGLWIEGEGFYDDSSEEEIIEWINSLNP